MRFPTANSSLPKICGLFSLFICLQTSATPTALADCKAVLQNDTLTLENSKLKRSFLWNDGALQSISLYNKTVHFSISGATLPSAADMHLPGLQGINTNGSFRTYEVPASAVANAYRAAEIVVQMGELQLKRVFRIYPDCPAIPCDYYMRGNATNWKVAFSAEESNKAIEDARTRSALEDKTLVTDRVSISGNHWRLKAVEFSDVTDYNNNLVTEYDRLLYRMDTRLRGNLLLAQNLTSGAGFFMLKESPVSATQLYYQGFDFTAKWGEVKSVGLGIAPQDVNDSNWVSGYTIVTGVAQASGEQALLRALRTYQQTQRTYLPQRDDMLMANTWGDRSRDSRVNEAFILQEITAAAKLGITWLQIDDGWQRGRSSNSASGGTLTGIWNISGYWQLDSVKFPGGFARLLAAAKKVNIQIALWFNPSTDSSFANCEKDADVLIDQYKNYGIHVWKIDGVQITDKQGEINFRRFLDKVVAATHNEALFNLDVTAGRRFGYHYLHNYGSLFLENRYTDWGNYYPHFTLRNLWQLSRYLPPQRLQIEYLNKWRNQDKYAAHDALAPAAYSFDYLFAISMVAQPLAWMEVSKLPDSAFATANLIARYKTIAADLHHGQIFPIGEEPSGFSWTGFQSMQQGKGNILLFRENNDEQIKTIHTLLPAGKKVQLKLVAGQGKNFNAITSEKGSIAFELAKPRSFVLYAYTIL